MTTLIAGPVQLATPENVNRIDVVSAHNMYDAAMAQIGACDIFVGCAAVADYRPAEEQPQKIKKGAERMQLELVRNPDIIAAVAAGDPRPFTVGFAAETQDVLEYARSKLRDKRLDMIVANDVSGDEAGFNSVQNAATFIWPDGSREIPLTTKAQLATMLVECIAGQWHTLKGKVA